MKKDNKAILWDELEQKTKKVIIWAYIFGIFGGLCLGAVAVCIGLLFVIC